MQAIPASGAAMGIQYREQQGLTDGWGDDKPVVMCSIGDAAMTEGEVSEALQMAALKQYSLSPHPGSEVAEASLTHRDENQLW